MKKIVKEEKQNKKALKIIMIIILLLIVILLLHTTRNFIIITNLQNNISKHINNKNYSLFITSKMQGEMTLKVTKHQKNNNEVILLERYMNNEIVKMSIYNNGERVDSFVETSESKIATLNVSDYVNVNIVDRLKTENIWQKIFYSIITKIKSIDYNGKKCYVVSNFAETLYIEKDTGLCLLIDTQNQQDEMKYEFNNVDDSIFIKPDISQYKIKE